MNDQFVGREICRKIAAFDGGEFKVATDILLQPARNFDVADVFFDGMMGAGLGDQDAVAGLECFDGNGGTGLRDEIALETRRQNGKRSERNGVRSDPGDTVRRPARR